MKKYVAMLLVLIMMVPTVPSMAAGMNIISNGKTGTYDAIKVVVNGKTVNTKGKHGFLEDGNALVPYKDIFGTACGIKTAYSSSKKTITFAHNNHKVTMTLGQLTATVDGVKKTMPVAPKVVTYKSSKLKKIVVPSRFVATSLGLGYKWTPENKTIALTVAKANNTTNKSFQIYYNGKTVTYKNAPVNIVVGKTKLKTTMPGLKIGNNILVPASATFATSGIKASYIFDSKTGDMLTMMKGKNSIELILGTKNVKVNGKATVMPYSSYIIKHVAQNKSYIMVPAQYVAESLGYDYAWNEKTSTVTITTKKAPETPTTEAPTTEEPAVDLPEDTDELKAMWISYLEFGAKAKTKAAFETKVDTMFDDSVAMGMNAVIVQVRPFADAMYPSDYFPWSAYASGTQGKSVNYDPLKYMVSAAHKRGLKFHAWVNPYRITGADGVDAITKLSTDNPARIWYESDNATDNRNVLYYDKMYYFNPASKAVRDLIINGVKEIATNYAVDGIHMDDYFYPTFTSANVSTAFDAPEYSTYKSANAAAGKKSLSIADWRRANVNTLVKDIYSGVQKVNDTCVFGISPAGNLNNLRSDLQYYVDVDTWVSNKGYVDYICPQIYWGFNDKTAFDKVLNQWTELNQKRLVDLHIGIAVYRAGSTITDEWKNGKDILKREVTYARETQKVDGFMFYRYDYFNKADTKTEVTNLISILK